MNQQATPNEATNIQMAPCDIHLATKLSVAIAEQLNAALIKSITERPAVFFEGEDPASGFFEEMLDEYNYIRANAFSDVFDLDLGPDEAEAYEAILDMADDLVLTGLSGGMGIN